MYLLEERKDHRGGSEPEGNIVGQRIQLLAHRIGDTKHPCQHAVEEVESSSNKDEPERSFVIPLKSHYRCDTTGEQIATGNGVRDVSN